MLNSALCLIKGSWAYFTDAPLEYQWGDDWEDRPYWCNAEEPNPFYGKERVPCEITRVAFDSELTLPGDKYSVQDINYGIVPWLTDGDTYIYAGTTMAEFMDKIKDVYLTEDQWKNLMTDGLLF